MATGAVAVATGFDGRVVGIGSKAPDATLQETTLKDEEWTPPRKLQKMEQRSRTTRFKQIIQLEEENQERIS